ncbi:TPA: hypothetical protein HA281_03625 [Candidatus Woesearchaeota archaeon]|nr:hypothetical protein [Candidatus Woesearchaeota archaeon]HIH91867.1 hypothetical protein [Candidatus Woesearchaeota archaeon]HII64211.1 hypothetical protein [Candidatus Woesearchaeota archaeon]
MKKVRVVFSPEAEEVYIYLNQQAAASKKEGSILNGIHKKVGLIKANVHYGDPIAKKLIPEEYKARYGITNLFRVELPDFWRMLYTLTDGETEIDIIAFVLDVVDHKEYNRKFGYR